MRMEDGTIIELNTNSRIAMSLTRERRTVTLLAGEALVDVGRDPRPFEVHVGKAVIEDVGTRFNVRRFAETLDVAVQSGQVNVSIVHRAKNGDSASRRLASLSAGQAVTMSIDANTSVLAVRSISDEEMSQLLAWTKGQLAFRGETLSEIVAQFNRFNVRQLEIADPRIAGLRLGGRFQADEPEVFVKALQSVGVRAQSSSDGPIRLVGTQP